MSGAPIFGQEHFRFRSDTGTVNNASPTWLAAEDTSVTMLATTVPFRLRIGVQNTGTATASLANLLWSKNGGAYTTFSTASSGVIYNSSASSDVDNTGVTTGNFRLTAMSGGKIAGFYDSNGVYLVGVNSNANIELEFGLSLVATDFVNGDTIEFRVYSTGSTALTSYDVTPKITIGSGTTQNIMGQIVL